MYKLNNEFTALSETSGIFYVQPGYSVEIATGSNPQKDSGFVIKGGEPVYFEGKGTVYARATGTNATLNVVDGKLS